MPKLTVGTPVLLSASASSGLPVSLTSKTADVCTVSGNTLTPIAAGACTVAADQAGSAAYSAAPTVIQSAAASGPAPANNIAVSFSANPVVSGDTAKATARIASATAEGKVTFTVGDIVVCAGAPLKDGAAVCSLGKYTPGNYTVTASYGKDAAKISGSAVLTVQKAQTTLTLKLSPNPVKAGKEVNAVVHLRATAHGAGLPSGIITIGSGATSCTATLPQTNCKLQFITAGAVQVTGSYSGDANFQASLSDAVDLIVKTEE